MNSATDERREQAYVLELYRNSTVMQSGIINSLAASLGKNPPRYWSLNTTEALGSFNRF